MRKKNKGPDDQRPVNFKWKKKQKQHNQQQQYHERRRPQPYQKSRQNGEAMVDVTLPRRSLQQFAGTSTMVRPKIEFDESGGPVKLAVISDGYPEEKLDADQITLIKDYLLEMIDTLDAHSVSPKFEDAVEEDGVLVLFCANGETSDWLYDVIKGCCPWQGAKLWLVEAKYLAAVVKTTVFIPQKQILSNHEKMLHRFQVQNNLDTGRWMIINMEVEDGGQRYVIMMDELSWQLIEAKGFTLFFGFGKVNFVRCN